MLMKQLFFTLLLIFSLVATVSANTQPAIIFSQNVVAVDADGNLIPSVKIDPLSIVGMQTYDFDLGRERLLRIQTNIRDTEERSLNDVVGLVNRCYSYIETTTGKKLTRGVLLYLIELDKIPYAYSFSASFKEDSQWQEVRLALIERDAPLSGQQAAPALIDLLYDTLPHELGHDVLGDIPQLLHDIDGNTSHHTRWFIEGICEVLAKGFSRREDPVLYRHFLSLRSVDDSLSKAQKPFNLFNWAQDNDNDMVVESEFYSVAMLTMMAWVENVNLADLLEQLEIQQRPIQGTDLLAIMQQTTGVSSEEIINRKHSPGRRLDKEISLGLL